MLAAGAPTRIVMCRTVARALTATRLGDLSDVLGSLGIERQGVLQVMYSGLGDHAGAISDAADIPIEEDRYIQAVQTRATTPQARKAIANSCSKRSPA